MDGFMNMSGVPGGNEAERLLKALTAGDSANPATMTSGNTLQIESLEGVLLDALEQRPEDFKLMKMLFKNNIGTTIHQYSVNLDSGDPAGVFAAELADPRSSDSELKRRTRAVKFMQTKREVSLQAMMQKGLEEAERLEQKNGSHVLLKAAEAGCFQGNETASPDQYDSVINQIRNSDNDPNVIDMNGLRMTDAGAEAKFEEAIQLISQRGGRATDAFFPYPLAQDFQNIVRDRVRFGTEDKSFRPVLEDWPSIYDTTVKIAGRAGQNKLFKVKGIPTPSPVAFRPGAPTFALAAQAKTGGTGFVTSTAGTYRYTVYAVDRTGAVSVAAAAANLAVANGEEAEITITRNADLLATGYIICRGKKDVTTGDVIYEMFRVADSGAATTVALDQNDELPGTAEIAVISNGGDSYERTIQWDSFVDLMRFDLGRTKASIPFLMVWYGTPDVKIPERNAVIKNVSNYQVDGWF